MQRIENRKKTDTLAEVEALFNIEEEVESTEEEIVKRTHWIWDHLVIFMGPTNNLIGKICQI